MTKQGIGLSRSRTWRQRAATSSLCKTSAVDMSRRENGIRSNAKRRMVTTRLNGPERCHIRTEKWGCSADRMSALTKPPHLAAICPTVTASNYHENWTYQGGAFEQWFNQSWTSGLAENTETRRWNGLKTAIDGMKTQPLTEYPVMKADAR